MLSVVVSYFSSCRHTCELFTLLNSNLQPINQFKLQTIHRPLGLAELLNKYVFLLIKCIVAESAQRKKSRRSKKLVSALKSWYLEFGQYCLDEQRWWRWSIWDHDHQMERSNATRSHVRMHPQILIRSSSERPPFTMDQMMWWEKAKPRESLQWRILSKVFLLF